MGDDADCELMACLWDPCGAPTFYENGCPLRSRRSRWTRWACTKLRAPFLELGTRRAVEEEAPADA